MTAVCPDCTTDLIDEAFTFWCPVCQRAVPYNEVIIWGEGDD